MTSNDGVESTSCYPVPWVVHQYTPTTSHAACCGHVAVLPGGDGRVSTHSTSALDLMHPLPVAATLTGYLLPRIRELRFSSSCIVSMLFLVVVVMTSPNNHVGTRISSAASMMVGPAWPGVLAAGGVVSHPWDQQMQQPSHASSTMEAVGCSRQCDFLVNPALAVIPAATQAAHTCTTQAMPGESTGKHAPGRTSPAHS